MRTRSLLLGWLALTMVFAAGTSVAQGQTPSFRDLVRKFVAQQNSTATTSGGGPLALLPEGLDKIVALEYTVLRRTPAGDEPVDANTHQFRIGDQVRLRIKPLSGLYIYIFHEGASGHRTCLLPLDKEQPPLAQPDKMLELPADGSVFEFAPPAGTEKLIVVALEQPSADLATLSDMIFKKPDGQLTADEQRAQAMLRAKHEQTLKSILERQAHGTRYRGLFTDAALGEAAREAQRRGSQHLVYEEPPHGQTTSTLALAASKRDGGKGELYVTIPLKSTGK